MAKELFDLDLNSKRYVARRYGTSIYHKWKIRLEGWYGTRSLNLSLMSATAVRTGMIICYVQALDPETGR
jgi:hypothetical protein